MDIINFLSGTDLAERNDRLQAKDNAQLSFEALLEGELPERYAVAAFVAGLHRSPVAEFYFDLLGDENPGLMQPVAEAVATGLNTWGSGPAEQGQARWFSAATLPHADALGQRLVAALDFSHFLVFNPVDSTPERLAALAKVFTEDETVTLAQLISFLAFQLRVVHGLVVLDGRETAPLPAPASSAPATTVASDEGSAPTALIGGVYEVLTYPGLVEPSHFVHHSLGWKPWVPDLGEDELTEAHLEAMILPERAKSSYFRLLARDPQALKARTLTDLDIFYNIDTGIGRAERELAATVASRFNGCIYCASVHSARTLEESKGRIADVERLLEQGAGADLGSDTWNAIRDTTVALTRTPIEFGQRHVHQLKALGLETGDMIDIINAAAFFNWANRLMLSLGAPEVPRRFRNH
ncbi:alkylhydroperoxidase domain protein [Rothia sp. (in: high G+C Gram-positive bacteria)]|uniref:alkylhydroperoxidase domain protein n=1 Tax=Rothia sp. (in: high G+C Gram-positive bacteria) TaxID=1885016 RepID=UPI000EC162AD|nr:alkylhydroperoxidase [Rothia sp. (in: high G+C Gram-positive bacteria)]